MKKTKYILDCINFVLMIILMGYQVTGDVWHEIFGITLFLCFILHCILNINWFKKFLINAKNSKKSMILVIWFITNILLIVDMIVLMCTSIFISKHVFTFTGLTSGSLVVYLHTASAYFGFIIMSVHLGCHMKMILSSICKSFHLNMESSQCKVIFRIIAFILAVMGFVASFNRHIASKFKYTDSTKDESNINTLDEKKKSDENITQSAEQDDGETLNDYLSKLHCSGCSKHCSLLNPRCSKGRNQAKEAKTEYEERVNQNTTKEENTQKSTTDSDNLSTGETIKLKIDDEQDDLYHLFRDYVPIAGLYVVGTYYVIEFIKKKKK